MYKKHFGMTVTADSERGVATLRPQRGASIRLFTAHTLFARQSAMQEVPRPIAVTFGSLLTLPTEHLRHAGRHGLVTVDDLEGSRDTAVAIPLLRLISRGLAPSALSDWWKEMFRRTKTLVVLDPENLMSSNKRKTMMPLLRSMRPVGVITN